MSLRILQLGRACFGAQEEMCISSNQIEPAGTAGRGLKQGLPGCNSWGKARGSGGCRLAARWGELPAGVCWIATFPTSRHPADAILHRG